MNYLLFVIYLIFFCWLVTRISFFKNNGIQYKWLVLLFLIKVAAGAYYGWFYAQMPDFKTKADTWRFFYDGMDELKILFNHPADYFTNLFSNEYEDGYKHFFAASKSYWNDLKNNVMIKLVSVFNLLSFGNYYINVIFYSFITFFGQFALLKVLSKVYKHTILPLIIGIFLLPSFTLWCNGIHKDGLIFTALSFLIYHFFFAVKQDGFNFKRITGIFICLVAIFPLRNYIVMALIPGLFAWFFAERYIHHSWKIFLTIYLLFTAAFFSSKYVVAKIDLPLSVKLRQLEFFKLKANSYIKTDTLEANAVSFIKNAPQSLNHTTIRPYLSETKGFLFMISAIEILLYWLLFIGWIFYRKKQSYTEPVVLFFLFFSITILLIIGFIVPFLGAIVRYRSIVLPFLISPLLCTIDWQKFLKKNKNLRIHFVK